MKTHHFWYSKGQKEIGQKFMPQSSHCEVLIPGTARFVTYTECSTKKKPSGKWDDYIYLGNVPGKDFWKSLRIDGVRQGQDK